MKGREEKVTGFDLCLVVLRNQRQILSIQALLGHLSAELTPLGSQLWEHPVWEADMVNVRAETAWL